jgi:hypothetical protein
MLRLLCILSVALAGSSVREHGGVTHNAVLPFSCENFSAAASEATNRV